MRVGLAVLGVIAGAALGFAAPAAAPRIPRAELEGLQASVEEAVTRVSRPAGLMFGRASRAYHLRGYGAVVVLAPRALPRALGVAGGPEGRAYADLLSRLERSIEDVSDPEERRRLEDTLVALRNGPTGRRRLIPPPRPRLAAPRRDIQSLQEEAEAFRREAERAMEKAERDVLVRLRVTDDGRPFIFMTPPDTPEPPAPPDAPHPGEAATSALPTLASEEPPAPPLPRVPPVAPVPPVPRVALRPPPPPAVAFGSPPGWPFWFGEVEAEDAPPARVLADVRRAITAGLGAYRGGFAMLGPDEFVVVAVDFVPRLADSAGSRTVVARARKRDLVDHRAGRLSAAALHARVEFDEY